MPELGELVKSPSSDDGNGLLSPLSEGGMSSERGGSDENGPLSAGLSINDDEDVADQAERLLMGLKSEGADGDDDDEGVDGVASPVPRESIRMSRRRKEGAEDERSKRRRRRQLAMSASEASLEMHAGSVRDSTTSSVGLRDSTLGSSRSDSRQEGIKEDADDDDGGETPKQPQPNGDIGAPDMIISPPSPSPDSTPTKGREAGLPTPPGD
jgi:cytokinesis protein